VTARVESTIPAPPEAVFAMLCDGEAYDHWVVGSKRIRDVELDWPQVGSVFHHRVGIGPIFSNDTSQVLVNEPPHRLVLDVRFRPYGSARVELVLEPDAEGTKVTMIETPTSGIFRVVPDPITDRLLNARNKASLVRLRSLVTEGKNFPVVGQQVR
jgi:uncharacterized protein YndB with AHSA1/START domain